MTAFMTNIDLAEYIEKWFKKTDFNDKNIWNRSPVGIVLKSKLKKIGHWRSKPKKFLDF
jgi:hypothetical protein